LKYRLPNIEEGFYFLALIERIENYTDIFRIKGKMLGQMAEMICYKDLGYESFKEFLEDKENNLHAAQEIAEEVYEDIVGALKKKT
jgi:hypothetical protein